MYKVGNRVVIIRKDIKDLTTALGTITNIDGAYIMVRLDNSNREIELYPNEIKPRE